MDKTRIRLQFKFYRNKNNQLKEANRVVDIHRRRDLTDLENRIEELEREVRFYRSNGHRRI